MAAPLPRHRLLRTYGAAGGRGPRRRPGGAGAQWFAPPGPRRFFSSSSSSSSSGASSSEEPSRCVPSDDPDDPDFCSPLGRRPRRAGGRLPEARPSPTATPSRLRPRRAPRPQHCSTPCGSLPGSPGPFSPGLSACGRSADAGPLRPGASLSGSPAGAGPGSAPPGPGDSVCLAAASPDQAPRPRPALSSRADSGTGGKGTRRARRARALPGRRLESPGFSGARRKTAADRHSRPEPGTQGAAQPECEQAGGTGPGRQGDPRRAAAAPVPQHDEFTAGRTPERGPSRPQDLTRSQKACAWTKARASFGFHKKKVVSAVSEVGGGHPAASSPSASLTAEHSQPPVTNRASGAWSPWHSSSMYLLSPFETLHGADKKAPYAEKVYRECSQEGPVPFSSCLSAERLECCEKIGEGVFGEVFQTSANHRAVALKVIAVEGPDLINGTHQKTFEEILPEIIISKELSLLSEEARNRTEGFLGLNSVHCVQGPYPPLLLKAWDRYNSTKGSANDRPDFFGEDQLFIVLEFEFGGIDLEQMRRELPSIAAAKSILHQITASLAVAEASLHFEHRDLHWGNVLLKKTSLKEVHYTLNGKTSTIPTRGLQVSIIDYTLSRLERDGIVVFCDISTDEDLFTGEGDYQFEIYRLMRRDNNNCWGEYHPYSNVLWLHYLTDKILKEMTFKNKCNTPSMKQTRKKILHFHKTVLNFRSATDLLCQHSLFK